MLARPLDRPPVVLWGDVDKIDTWLDTNPNENVEALVLSTETPKKYPHQNLVVTLDQLESLNAQIVIAVNAVTPDPSTEAHLLSQVPHRMILLYPEELGEIHNPLGNDRASFSFI